MNQNNEWKFGFAGLVIGGIIGTVGSWFLTFNAAHLHGLLGIIIFLLLSGPCSLVGCLPIFCVFNLFAKKPQ